MLYLIDTYNLVHAAAGFGGMASEMTVRKLCQFILAASGSSGARGGIRVTLVLDGRSKPQEPSENEFPDITLVYSGIGITADTVIGQRVERAKSRKKLTVVSNDREVTRHARRHYAGVMSCEAFLKLLTEKPRGNRSALPANKTGGTQTSGETAHWMKEFGLEGNDSPEGKPRQKAGEIEGLDIEGLLGPSGEV